MTTDMDKRRMASESQPSKPVQKRSMKAAVGKLLKPRAQLSLRDLSMSNAVRSLTQNTKSKKRVRFVLDRAESLPRGKVWMRWWMSHGGAYVLKVRARSGPYRARRASVFRIIILRSSFGRHMRPLGASLRIAGRGLGGDALTVDARAPR
jgi:hypothetical protein